MKRGKPEWMAHVNLCVDSSGIRLTTEPLACVSCSCRASEPNPNRKTKKIRPAFANLIFLVQRFDSS